MSFEYEFYGALGDEPDCYLQDDSYQDCLPTRTVGDVRSEIEAIKAEIEGEHDWLESVREELVAKHRRNYFVRTEEVVQYFTDRDMSREHSEMRRLHHSLRQLEREELELIEGDFDELTDATDWNWSRASSRDHEYLTDRSQDQSRGRKARRRGKFRRLSRRVLRALKATPLFTP